MVSEADVRSTLDRVVHPSFGLSLIALNMVRAVRVSADLIEVDLVMRGACPGCPTGGSDAGASAPKSHRVEWRRCAAESAAAGMDATVGITRDTRPDHSCKFADRILCSSVARDIAGATVSSDSQVRAAAARPR